MAPRLEKKIKSLSLSSADKPAGKPAVQKETPIPGSEFKDPNDDIAPLSPDTPELIALIELNDATNLAKRLADTPADATRRLKDTDGTSLLHIAARASAVDAIPILLSHGSDPTLSALRGGNTRAYDACLDRPTRDAFRAWRRENPDVWDYSRTGIPEPNDASRDAAREAKKAEKRAKQRERDKQRKREKQEREQREAAEEAAQRERDVAAAAKRKKTMLTLSRTEKAGAGMSAEARMRLDRYTDARI